MRAAAFRPTNRVWSPKSAGRRKAGPPPPRPRRTSWARRGAHPQQRQRLGRGRFRRCPSTAFSQRSPPALRRPVEFQRAPARHGAHPAGGAALRGPRGEPAGRSAPAGQSRSPDLAAPPMPAAAQPPLPALYSGRHGHLGLGVAWRPRGFSDPRHIGTHSHSGAGTRPARPRPPPPWRCAGQGLAGAGRGCSSSCRTGCVEGGVTPPRSLSFSPPRPHPSFPRHLQPPLERNDELRRPATDGPSPKSSSARRVDLKDPAWPCLSSVSLPLTGPASWL